MLKQVKTCLFSTLFSAIFLLPGCADLTFQSSPISAANVPTTTTKKIEKKPDTKAPRVFTMRGFLGIFSRGMDTLSTRVNNELQIESISVAALEWPTLSHYIIEQKKLGNMQGPLILIGHSQGADDQIETSRRLAAQHIPVDLLILIGPFNPNPIPSNVKNVLNLDRSFAAGKVIPFLGHVTVKVVDTNKTKMETLELSETPMHFDLGSINHFNIDKNKQVQDLILSRIKKTVEIMKKTA